MSGTAQIGHATDRIEPIVARLHALFPVLIDLSLDRLRTLLGKLGHPERRLPPVIHVAGTNGKGSTCANLRAIGEAAGWRVHVYTSPHLVHFRERIRVGGTYVGDERLAATLERIESVNDGAPITVFEVITAAAFVLFAETPADLCVLEVGLGGRADATNVIETAAACAIASISLDHQEMLGDTIGLIAREKAGILKAGVPAVTVAQAPEALRALRDAAAPLTQLLVRGEDWDVAEHGAGLRYTDRAGALDLPRPGLAGTHQVENAGLAVAALRASLLPAPRGAYRGIADAEWPARFQHLHGRLAALAPDREIWLDGGHNEGAAHAIARQLDAWPGRTHVIVGMKRSKNPSVFLAPIVPRAASVQAVQEPGQHNALQVHEIIAAAPGVRPGPTVAEALAHLPGPGRVLICGSLYLAGEVLKADGTGA